MKSYVGTFLSVVATFGLIFSSVSPAVIEAQTPDPSSATPEPVEVDSFQPTFIALNAAGGAVGCGSAYDNLHPGKSSDRRRVNAHHTVTCKGTDAHLVKIVVTSRMASGGRVGTTYSNTNKKQVRTGGDLACKPTTSVYQAYGTYKVTFPTGYKPLTPLSASKFSERANFKQLKDGTCARV